MYIYSGRLSKVNIALITIAGFVVFVLCLNLIVGIIQRIRGTITKRLSEQMHYYIMIFVLRFSFSFGCTATDRRLLRELGDWHNEVTREIDSRFTLYQFPEIRDATGNFSEENRLGHGSFGFVYRVGEALLCCSGLWF